MKNIKRKNEDIHLDILIFISIIILTLLPISPPNYIDSNYSSSPQTGLTLKSIFPSAMGELVFSKLILLSNENEKYLQNIEQYVDIVYTLRGIGAAILILLIYIHMVSKEQELIESHPQAPYSHEIWKKLGLEKLNQEEYEVTRIELFTAIPVVCLSLAELLIFAGHVKFGIWMHIGILIAFSLSNMIVKDLKVYRIYEALMLLPILRLVNLSMPVFFDTTLYTFVFVYGPLLVPLAIIVMHQRHSLEKIGLTSKNLVTDTVLSIPLGFLLGLREYTIMRPGYLIPDLSTENLLKLTFIMIFFVGLVEEVIFRSLLQTRLEETVGIREALIITGILFGLMHSGYGNFYEVLYAGCAGLFIGYSFYKTRSLPFVVMTHGLINVFLFGIFPHNMSNWIWV